MVSSALQSTTACACILIITSAAVGARLAKDGWLEIDRRGSHVQFKHPSKPGPVTVPHPKRDIPLGTCGTWPRRHWNSTTRA